LDDGIDRVCRVKIPPFDLATPSSVVNEIRVVDSDAKAGFRS